MEGDVKEQVSDRVPKRIKELKFGILSNQDIVNQAVVEVADRNVYELTSTGPERGLTRFGPMDERMGTSSKSKTCETCSEPLSTCNGHFGHVKLALPAFHIGYFRMIIDLLHNICKDCSRILLDDNTRRTYLRRLRQPDLDNMQRSKICRAISTECRKCKLCPWCGAVNGAVRKVPHHPLKMVHMKFDWFNKSSSKSKKAPPSKIRYDDSFDVAKQGGGDLEKHMKKAVDDMNPLRVLSLFRRISNTDCELLGMDPRVGRPEMFIWQFVPAPPVTIRPSVAQDSGNTEDDLTNKLGDIVQINSTIRAGLQAGQPIQTIMEQWEFLQIQIAMYINTDVPGLNNPSYGKPIRGFCQRLKGKSGRFRQNLSGKRVDFSGRTVIGPDPNLGIDEVAVPERVAINLTYPERVSRYNIEKLRNCIRRGHLKHPGANMLIRSDGRKSVLSVVGMVPGRLEQTAENLRIGDTVERHLEDGDIVLFNRQPSLHKLSILSHKAKIRPWRTFRLNECVCNPYNADFDGDEMNLHVPQTEEARIEAIELMGVKHNLATPKNGTPIIAAIQDFITAAFLLSSKNNFYDRKTFTQICGFMFNGDSILDPDTGKLMAIELPPPVVLKPETLWTGKQVFNVLMRPYSQCRVLVNLEAACKQFTPKGNEPKDLNEDDAYLVIRNSEVMCGVMDKATVGDGKKDSVFYVIMRDFGPDHAVQAMNRLSKLSARWLSNQGFSIGINDVTPGSELVTRKQMLVDKAYAECDELIKAFKEGRLQRDPGCDEEQTMENKIGGILSKVRQSAGNICFEELSNWNSPLIMAKCGSKGSALNVSQMVASVGQQMIGGKRVADGFQDRTLPHFPKAARQPASKGFVGNSFYSGLTPYEFIFHAMSGREGLVDTAVKTAETGYMSRRLMKSLEDLSSQYDGTVRSSSAGIVQFQYGDDNLDPVDMEAKAKPVNFDRTFTHAITSTWSSSDLGLIPQQILLVTKAKLDAERKRYPRVGLLNGEPLDYNDDSDYGIDQLESPRNFLDTVEDYIKGKVGRMIELYKRHGVAIPDGQGVQDTHHLMEGLSKISKRSLLEFLQLCLTKYERSKVQPGHAVGAVGAQSIGEPGTQMTLKTFHFAGVAGMSITQGVPRIKEIINASKNISTPVISCDLENKESEQACRIVKSRIEKTYLRDITAYVEEVWYNTGVYINMRVDWDTVEKLGLELTMDDIQRAIMTAKGLKMASDSEVRTYNSHVRVFVRDKDDSGKKRATVSKRTPTMEHFERVQSLKRALPNIVVKGYPDAQRAIIRKDDSPSRHDKDGKPIYNKQLLVEGYGLRACMTTEGINGYHTSTNSVMETKDVLGIEAARKTIVDEISSVMGNMDIDPRHMSLLADVMTFKGEILGITRFGLAKMRDSVLQLASFEKTPDHLFDAAFHMKKDKVEGVSECIIMGQVVNIGTGAFKVVRRLGLQEQELQKKSCLFESLFQTTNQGISVAG